MGLFRDNEKKIKRNITRLGIPTGKRRISWLFHMCGRGFELGTTAIQSSQRLVQDLNSGPMDYKYSAVTSRPRCFLISSNRYGFSPSLTGSCFLVSLRLPLCKWKPWHRASSYVVDAGNDVNSVMCYHQIAFSGDFLFPPRKKYIRH